MKPRKSCLEDFYIQFQQIQDYVVISLDLLTNFMKYLQIFVWFLLCLVTHIEQSSAQCYCEDCPEDIIANTVTTATLEIGGAINATLGVDGQALTIVGLQFIHEAAQELSMKIIAPDGSAVDLMIGEGLNFGDPEEFAIEFVQCSDGASPDCSNNDVWDSQDPWDDGPYTGTYYPEAGCLEDLTGSVNGIWTLEMNDSFVIEDGELICFSLAFEDPSGINCNNNDCSEDLCFAQGGLSMDPLGVDAPEGDPSLIIDYTITFGPCSGEAGPGYEFLYLIFDGTSLVLLEVTDEVDMTSYDEGIYAVFTISITSSDADVLDGLVNSITYGDLQDELNAQDICFDFNVNGSVVTITGSCDLPVEAIVEMDVITAEQNDPALDPDWDITYPNGEPDPAEYGFYWLVINADTDQIIAYYTTDDFTLLLEGNYYVVALWFDLDQLQDLPFIGEPFSNLEMAIDDGSLCAQFEGFNELFILESCDADAGELTENSITGCEFDDDLDIDLFSLVDFPNGEPNSSEYGYSFVTTELTGIPLVLSIDPINPNTLNVGTYEVCGFSYLLDHASTIATVPTNGSDINYFQNLIDDGTVCAEITTDCITIIITEAEVQPWFGPTEVCAGVEVTYEIEDFTGDLNDYLITIFSGSFTQFISNSDGTIDIIWSGDTDFGEICVGQPNLSCQIDSCLSITVNPGLEVDIIGEAEVCPGDQIIYELVPAETGGITYDINVDGGSIIDQTSSEVTIEWGSGISGEIELVVIGGSCSGAISTLEVNILPPVPFPTVTLPLINCSASGVAILDVDDPLISDWTWTATNADIVIANGFVNFDWQAAGPAQICLEIETACGIDQECFDLDILQSPTPELEQDIEICNLSTTLTAIISNGLSFFWTAPGSGGSVVFSDQTSPTTVVTFDGPGEYEIVFQEFGNPCGASTSTTVTVVDGIETSNPEFACTDDGLFYTVSFEVESGIAPYTVDGITIVGSEFESIPIASGSAYIFEIVDAAGCSTEIDGSHICPCISDAGTMDVAPISACVSDDVSLTGIHNLDDTQDSNDTGTFILHTDSGPSLGTEISTNNTGSFDFDPLTMQPGVTYYISFVVGDELNGGLDFNDPCLSVSPGTPVIWYDDPDVFAGDDVEVCGTEFDLTDNADDEFGEWSIVSTPNGAEANLQLISGQTIVEVDSDGLYIFSFEQTVNGCTASDEVSITFISNPTVSNLMIECENGDYVVSFMILGGEAPYQVDGGTVTDDVFVSDPIPSGDIYNFIVIDDAGCESDLVSGTKLCDCDSEAGIMSDELIILCAEDGALIEGEYVDGSSILDGDDNISWVLHTSPNNILGNVLAINDAPVFTYDLSYGSDLTLYISVIVGNASGNMVDLNDPCLGVSVGQPVELFSILSSLISAPETNCAFNVMLEVDDFGLAGSWAIVNAPVGANTEFVNQFDAISELEVSVGGQYELTWIHEGRPCIIPDTVEIFVIENLLTSNEDVFCGDNNYIVSFEITGGVMPYLVNGQMLNGSSFISTEIDQGMPFSFEITDASGCESLIMEGIDECACLTDAGTMSADTVRVCGANSFDMAALTNNDYTIDSELSYNLVIHDLPDANLGNIFAILPLEMNVEEDIISLGLDFNVLYYVSLAVGETGALIGLVDDPCLAIAEGTPLLFEETDLLEISGDVLTCTDTLMLMTNSFVQDLVWSSSSSEITFIDQISNTVTIIISEPGVYEIVVSSLTEDCLIPATITVESVDPPDAPSLAAPSILCNNDNGIFELDLVSLVLDGSLNGNWFLDGVMISSVLDARTLDPGTYVLNYITTNPFCGELISEVSLIVEACSCPTVEINTQDVSCFGLMDGELSIELLGADLSDATILIDDVEVDAQPVYFLSSGTYDLSILSSEFCKADVIFDINEPDSLILNLGLDLTVEPNESVTISAETNLMIDDIAIIQWENNNGIIEEEGLQLTSAYISNDSIALYIEDKNGCPVFDELEVIVNAPDDTLLLPNILSVNSANGNNLFDLRIINGLELVEYFRLYDRWGNLMYEVEQVDAQSELLTWDGNFKGQIVNPGVYLYSVKLIRNGQSESLIGDLTVLK